MSGVFRIAVLGRTGKGKTYWIRETLIPSCPRPVIVLDSEGDFTGGMRFASTSAFRDHVVREMGDKVERNPTGLYIVDCDKDATAVAFMRLFARTRLPGVIVIDEVNKWCDPRHIPDDLQAISKYGRKHGQSLVTAAQRPTDIHNDLLSQADCIVSFQQTLHDDVKRLSRYGDASRLPELDRGEYVAFLDTGKVPATL